MDDHLRELQDRIEGILVLIHACDKTSDRIRLMRSLRPLIEEVDRLVQEGASNLIQRHKPDGKD